MAKGRKALEIDLVALQETIKTIETESQPPQSRSDLWKRVAAIFQPKASPQTLMTKAEKNNLQVSTPKGKRGKNIVEGGPTAEQRQRKPKKFLPQHEESVRTQFKRLGNKTVNKMLSGNIKSCIKAFCWDCMGESKKEVALCTAYSCPLWPHRPWKRGTVSLPVIEPEGKLEAGECGA